MPTELSRRFFLLSGAGFAALASNGCGGGSGAPAPAPSRGGGTPSPRAVSGFVWYEREAGLFKVQGGVGEPVRENSLQPDGRSGSDSGCMILYFDAATHAQQGFVDMNGYVVNARASSSGNYIAMVRGPDYINTLNLTTSENIAGLTVVDISDPKKLASHPLQLRSGRRGGDPVRLARQ